MEGIQIYMTDMVQLTNILLKSKQLSDLTHYRRNELTHTIYWKIDSNFNFRYVRLCDLDILREKWLNYLQTVANPDQMPHSAASDLGLQCLPITLLGVSRL